MLQALLVLLGIALGTSLIGRVVRARAGLANVIVTAVALVAWLPAWIQLHLLDPMLQRRGSMERLRSRIRNVADPEQ